MSRIRLVLIGAGSTEFTPGLLADLVAHPDLCNSDIALVDIDPSAVDTMTKLARRMAEAKGVGLTVSGTTDQREALPGADFVTTTIAVGGARAWESDVRIPERYGVYQTVGDSVGPGGVFRALRHVPVIAELAQDMEDLCPDAWLFNYTNPLSAIVRGIQKSSSIRSAGLCHGVLHTRQLIARDLGHPVEDVNVVFAGVNHLCWLLDVRANGHDLYPEFREFLTSGLAAPVGGGEGVYGAFQQVSAMLTELYGCFPSPGDRHVAEFFPWFLRKHGDHLGYGTQRGLDMTNRIFASKDTTRERLRAQADGTEPLDPALMSDAREGERLISIIDAIVHDRRMPELAVNVRNEGLIANLPDWAIVEVPGQISGFGVRGVSVGPIPDAIAGILRQRIHQQELTVDAALQGNRDLALQALLADPLMANTSLESATAMLDENLSTHHRFLPRFASTGAL
jgi:alpha-galactosidase